VARESLVLHKTSCSLGRPADSLRPPLGGRLPVCSPNVAGRNVAAPLHAKCPTARRRRRRGKSYSGEKGCPHGELPSWRETLVYACYHELACNQLAGQRRPLSFGGPASRFRCPSQPSGSTNGSKEHAVWPALRRRLNVSTRVWPPESGQQVASKRPAVKRPAKCMRVARMCAWPAERASVVGPKGRRRWSLERVAKSGPSWPCAANFMGDGASP